MWGRIASTRAAVGAEERLYTELLFAKSADHGRTIEISPATTRVHAFRPTWRLVPAAAALLAAGILIGIGIRPAAEQPGPVSRQAVATAVNANLAKITADHFAASQRLLATLASSRDARTPTDSDAEVVGRARALLSTTQILLDSPTGISPDRRRLLSDLELVLAQIVQLAPEPRPGDADLVQDAIDGTRMIPRLQSAASAGVTWGS